MTKAKKYFWLKLQDDFFKTKEIKKMRRVAGGDTYVIIYLKLQLLSIKNEGSLFFEEIEDSFAEEMALEIDEEPENVKVCFALLMQMGLIEEVDPKTVLLPKVLGLIGSESESAERVRRHREQKKVLQSNGIELQSNTPETKSNTEIEREKEIEREQTSKSNDFNVCSGFQKSEQKKSDSKRFLPPSIEEIKTMIDQKGYSVDAERFWAFYESNGWMVGKNKMKSWPAALVTWNNSSKGTQQPQRQPQRPTGKRSPLDWNMQQQAEVFERSLALIRAQDA